MESPSKNPFVKYCSIIVLAVFTVFAFKNSIIPHIKEEREKVKIKAKAIHLNHYLPSFGDLVKFVADTKRGQAGNLSAYKKYYGKVVEAFPQISEAHGILGFCDFYLGNELSARNSLQKSIITNPNNFWSHYNLGVIQFKNSEYGPALKSFTSAAKINPQITMNLLSNSKVYTQVFGGLGNINELVVRDIKRTYHNNKSLMTICAKQLSPDEKSRISADKIDAINKGLNLEIF